MREILFRAKRKDNGEWAEGYFVIEGISYYIYSHPKVAKGTDLGGYLDCNDKYEIDPDTLGQFTGIYDKNGVKIFEGDIVRANWGYNGEVVYDSFVYAMMECIVSDDIKVVGNIHDNPELLEVK